MNLKNMNTFAKCTVCNSHFCCAHSGRYDCKRHIESKQHKKEQVGKDQEKTS